MRIEILANKIAKKLALQLNFDDERRDIIAYGLIGLLQMLTLFIIITIIGLVFDLVYEALIIFFGVGIIRKSSGGAHARTMLSCNIMSVLTVLVLSALSRYIIGIPIGIYINLGFSVITFAICYIIFYFRVPVDSPNKPITKPEKIKRLRNQSLSSLSILFIISITLILLATYNTRLYSFAISIRLAMLWQFLTLTKIGALFIEKMDSIIYWVFVNR